MTRTESYEFRARALNIMGQVMDLYDDTNRLIPQFSDTEVLKDLKDAESNLEEAQVKFSYMGDRHGSSS